MVGCGLSYKPIKIAESNKWFRGDFENGASIRANAQLAAAGVSSAVEIAVNTLGQTRARVGAIGSGLKTIK